MTCCVSPKVTLFTCLLIQDNFLMSVNSKPLGIHKRKEMLHRVYTHVEEWDNEHLIIVNVCAISSLINHKRK